MPNVSCRSKQQIASGNALITCDDSAEDGVAEEEEEEAAQGVGEQESGVGDGG